MALAVRQNPVSFQRSRALVHYNCDVIFSFCLCMATCYEPSHTKSIAHDFFAIFPNESSLRIEMMYISRKSNGENENEKKKWFGMELDMRRRCEIHFEYLDQHFSNVCSIWSSLCGVIFSVRDSPAKTHLIKSHSRKSLECEQKIGWDLNPHAFLEINETLNTHIRI